MVHQHNAPAWTLDTPVAGRDVNELIDHVSPCMPEIYLHIFARMADDIATYNHAWMIFTYILVARAYLPVGGRDVDHGYARRDGSSASQTKSHRHATP